MSSRNRAQTPWYKGPALLDHLETVDVDTALADKPFRLPVQWVNRPNLDFRGFSGTIAGGRVKPGDSVAVAKSGRTHQGHAHRHHGWRSRRSASPAMPSR